MDTKIDKRVFLKVKLKSLAAEAKIIKEMEKKYRNEREELHNHRVNVVRWEARHTHLVYGFLRGLKREQIEKTKHFVDFRKLETMLAKYGDMTKKQRDEFSDWLEGK